ncbi:MAG: hypothetical protein K2N27_01585 [Ruminococcus sp.]|nr:hypothetical protein [Ruminococcus sp.]
MLRYNEWTLSSCDSNIDHKVTDIRLYSDDNELVKIELKPVYMYPPENGTMLWEDWNHYDSICIYKTDYEKLLLPAISSLFPVTDPDPNGFGIQESFDLTSFNFFGKEDWQRLIVKLTECMKMVDETEISFYRSVLGFLKDFMVISDWFCIEGNL